MKAIGQRVIITPAEKEKITEGGIIIPISHVEDCTSGVVVSAGNRCKITQCNDVVIFEDDQIYYFPFEGQKYGILQEQHAIIVV